MKMWGYTALLPLVSALMWLGMLLGMLLSWLVGGRKYYPSMDSGQTVAYISDIGAFKLKPLFITGCAITVVTLDLAFLSERWLRHNGTLAPNTSTVQRSLSIASIVCAIGGAAGLILLSIFDTHHHGRMHNEFLLLFIAGYILSAIFICAEYQRLGIHYRNLRVLRISFWVKLTFILVEVALAIAFISELFTGDTNVAGVLEWIIAFIFTLYVLSFLLDLLPSIGNAKHVPQQGVREMTEKHLEEGSGEQKHAHPPAERNGT